MPLGNQDRQSLKRGVQTARTLVGDLSEIAGADNPWLAQFGVDLVEQASTLKTKLEQLDGIGRE